MPHLKYFTPTGVALAAVGDPGRDRTVYATILLLVALGFAMIMLAVWLFRNTRPDPQVLAPLERMGERRWRGADPVWQHRSLDEVRPREADPLEPSSAPPATDDEFERGPQPIGFDDLVASNTTTVDAPSGLPAPVAGAKPMEGPVEDVAAGGEAVADDGDSDTAEAVSDEDAATDADDDDDDDDEEDITGEQDGDDFLAVLDPARDVDLDMDFDADSDPDIRPDDDVDRDAEPDFDHDVAPAVDADSDADSDSGSDSGSGSDNDEDVVAG